MRVVDGKTLEAWKVLSDEQVVDRVRTGQTALFEVLMRRYNQRLYRVARALVGNDDRAEHVMEETYVNAYERLNQFDGVVPFAIWLTRILIDEALEHVPRQSASGYFQVDARDGRPADVPYVLLVNTGDETEMYWDSLVTRAQCAVDVCEDADAFDRVVASLPDVVVTDLMLPASDGIDLIRRLRRDGRTRHVGIVVVTAWSSSRDREKALQAGCDILLAKPCAPDVLVAAIQRAGSGCHLFRCCDSE